MALPTLEELTDTLDEKTVALLGDPFTLTPYGGSPIPLMGFIDHSERTRDYGFTTVREGDHIVEIRKTDRAAIANDDTIHLPRLSLDFLPKDVKSDQSGRWWGVALKRKPV